MEIVRFGTSTSVFVLFFVFMWPCFVFATPTGIILDIFEVQADALYGTSTKVQGQVAQYKAANFENIYAIVDAEMKVDLKDQGMLLKVVDKIYENLPKTYGDDLHIVTSVIDSARDVEKFIKLASIPSDIANILKSANKASEELASLLRNDTRGAILKNLLQYGTGSRDGKYTAMLNESNDLFTKANSLYTIVKELDSIKSGGEDIAERIFSFIIDGAKADIANTVIDDFSNGIWAKVSIQEMVLKKWKEDGVVGDNEMVLLGKQKIYSKDEEGIFFKTKIVQTYLTVNNKFTLFNNNDIYDIEIGGNNNYIKANNEKSNEDSTPYLSDGEKPVDKIAPKTDVNTELVKEEDEAKRADLAIKAREQLIIKNKEKSTDTSIKIQKNLINSYNILLSEKNSIENQISQIEKQRSGSSGNSTSANQTDIDRLRKYLEAYRYAASLSQKYNGDYSKLTGPELVQLKIRATNVFGAASYAKFFFNMSTKSSGQSQINNMQAQLDGYLASSGSNSSANTNLERQLQELRSRLNTVNNSLNNSSLSGLETKLHVLENDRNNLSAQLYDNQQHLAALVSDINNLDKLLLAANNSQNVGSVAYEGDFTAVYDSGWVTTAAALGPDNKPSPFIGMNLNPNNYQGVFSGDFKIATLSRSDSSGAYSYTSWGTWAATSPSQTYTEPNGNVGAFEGGHWVMGQLTEDIPKQGSASYQGNLSGDYIASGGGRSAGIISGSVSLNANFASNALTGSLNLLKNNVPWMAPPLINGSLSSHNGRFSAGLAGPPSGGVGGNFYGPNGVMPPEAGGEWWLRNNDGSAAAGIFRAKKQ